MNTIEIKKATFAGEVDVSKIDVLSQIRKKVDKARIAELAASIKDRGIINALTLRPGKNDRFILVCGERRLIASKQLGKKTVKAEVHQIDAIEASLYQADENLHREDLGPIEEATGFRRLLDAKKYSVEELAGKINKSIAYVYRATRLTELPKKILDAIDKGELQPGHGHQLLRIDVKEREKFFTEWHKSWQAEETEHSVKSLQGSIDDEVEHSLDKASFPKTKPYAGMLDCVACAYNSGNQGMLFPGAKKGSCTKPKCFTAKEKAFQEETTNEIQKRFPKAKIIKTQHAYPGLILSGFKVGKIIDIENPPRSLDATVLYNGDYYNARKMTTKEMKKSSSSSSSSNSTPRRSPEKAFIDKFIDDKAFVAIVDKITIKKMAEEVFNDITRGHPNQGYAARLKSIGYNSLGEFKKGFDKARTQEERLEFAATAVLCQKMAYSDAGKFANSYGIDTAKLRKKWKVEATKAWEAKKKK